MASKKSRKSGSRVRVPRTLQYLIRLARGPGRPVVVALGLLLALVAVWYPLWRIVRDRLLASDQYMVAAEDIEITPPPPWIRSDIRGEAYRDLIVDGPLSIMEPRAVKRTADAFALHPWVARVNRVTKHHPARIRVELEFRKPVCMVEVPGGLYPVDVQGVRLPSGDFTSVEASTRYPRLGGIDTLPLGPPGTRWGDERVVGAAEIAAAFGPSWRDMRLYRIIPDRQILSGRRSEFTYSLVTREGTRISWGRAPGTQIPGEVAAAEKVARLKAIFAEHGSLEAAGGLDLSQPAGGRVACAPAPAGG